MALVYNAAYNAAYIAGEKAVQMERMDVAEAYCKVQDACVAALDKIREDSEKDAPFEHREREIKLFSKPEPSETPDPSDGQSQEDEDHEYDEEHHFGGL